MKYPDPMPLREAALYMPLRALTLYDVWARMVVDGDKTIEVRSRPLKYRGPLLIHEAQHRDQPGAFVGIADLYDCRPLTADDLPAARLSELPADRAYGWHLRDALRLPARIEWRGRQGLWKPERRAGGDPGELRAVLDAALGPWGRGVAAAAERAELRLIWRLGTWWVHPPGDQDGRLRYHFTVSTPSTPSGSIGATSTVEVHGSKHDGGRAHREFCKEKALLIGKMGSRWPAAIGHRIKTGRETMGITKKEVSAAAHAVGLKLSSVKNAEGEWVLTDPAGVTVRADSSLASMLQHCRDLRQPPQEVVDVPAVSVPMEPDGGTKAFDHGCVANDVDRLYGDGADYDRDRIAAETRHYLAQGAMAMLEVGRRLCWLKDREPHGEWTALLERIGIHERAARRIMQAAHKFLDGPNRTLVSDLGSVTKVYELATLDDDDLDELRQGGTIAGMALDDIQRMTPTELRDTLRRERKERQEALAAQRERLENKDAKVRQLEDLSDDLHQRLDAARNPGRRTLTEAGRELLIESARVGRELEVAIENVQACVKRLYEISEREQAAAGGRLTIAGRDASPHAGGPAPAGKELLHVRGQLDAIATTARRALDALDEQLSDHLATERQPPDDIQPWDVVSDADADAEDAQGDD